MRVISARCAVKASSPSVGQPIPLARMMLAAGNLVVGHDTGVVVLQGGAFERTLAAGEARDAKVAEMMVSLATAKGDCRSGGVPRAREWDPKRAR